MRLMLACALIAFLADQISKYVVIHEMELFRRLLIDVWPPYLRFRYGENYGINFGLGSNGVSAWVWIVLALVICGWVVWWARRESLGPWGRISAGFLIGGAVGNVLDRLVYGYVLDFLNMSCCGLNNPYSFNVADVFVFLGAVGLMFPTPKAQKAR